MACPADIWAQGHRAAEGLVPLGANVTAAMGDKGLALCPMAPAGRVSDPQG